MFESLVQDVQIVILKEIPFSIGRGINKYFKILADKIELERDKYILITEDMILNFLNSDPTSFSYMIKSDTGLIKYKYRKSLNNYYICNKSQCLIESCQCNYHNPPRFIEDLRSYYQNDSKNCDIWKFYSIIPGYDIIEFSIMNHPLALVNKKFFIKRLKSTIDYYINTIKQGEHPEFYLKGVLSLLCWNLNINYDKLEFNQIKELIFDKIDDLYQ